MAHYTYKVCLYDTIPREDYQRLINTFEDRHGYGYEPGADYDGDDWLLTADYIKELQAKIKELELKNESKGG